jgi:glycosyltransferase EpsD
MKKILFVANIHKHFRAFHIPYIEYLKSEGYEVHVAANDCDTAVPEADKQFFLPIDRNPFSLNNVNAVSALKKIIRTEKYSLIHCHTAMGSIVARIAAKEFRKSGMLKVLYTAHGFHFYKGSPKLFWLIYYPIEKYLTKYTDGLITINMEDYQIAIDNSFKATNIFKTSGVGININKFTNLNLQDSSMIRKNHGYTDDIFIIIYIAEFIDRKDHRFILEAIPLLKEKIDNFKFIFAGRGMLQKAMENLAIDLKVNESVDFLGFRKDIGELIIMSDIGVSVSKQEGLPMNVAEVMFAAKPVVVTNIRGHIDLVEDTVSGLLFNKGDQNMFVSQIANLQKNPKLYDAISFNAKNNVRKFELSNCIEEMSAIYKKFL